VCHQAFAKFCSEFRGKFAIVPLQLPFSRFKTAHRSVIRSQNRNAAAELSVELSREPRSNARLIFIWLGGRNTPDPAWRARMAPRRAHSAAIPAGILSVVNVTGGGAL
jgi:hypothetical protein